MATLKNILVPDLGGVNNATVIEIFVKPGDQVTSSDSLITLESDKASMEIPAPYAGKIKEIKIKIGGKLSQGSIIGQMEITEEATVNQPPSGLRPPSSTKGEGNLSEAPQLPTPIPAPNNEPKTSTDIAAPIPSPLAGEGAEGGWRVLK